MLAEPGDAHNKTLVEALYTLLMVSFFGGRAELWPAFHTAVGRLRPRPPQLLSILAGTFSDPARLRPARPRSAGYRRSTACTPSPARRASSGPRSPAATSTASATAGSRCGGRYAMAATAAR